MEALRHFICWLRGLFTQTQEFDDEAPGPNPKQRGPWID
jgi:hypothetical protein